MKKAISAFGLGAFLTAATLVSAQEWGREGDWSIQVDPDAGPSCLMSKTFDDGLVVEMGYVKQPDGGFFAAYHPDWTDIKTGESGLVEFHFDDVGFGGDVELLEKNGLQGGYAFFDNPEFVSEFAKRNSVTIVGPSGREVDVSLKGSSRAIKGVKACQGEQK